MTPERRQRTDLWVVIGSLAAVLAVLLVLFPPGSNLWGITGSPAVPDTTLPSTPAAPEVQPTPSIEATAPEPSVAEIPVAAPAPVMQSIVVDTVVATPAVPCCRVGPGLFQLQESSRSATGYTTAVGYKWSSRMSDGTEKTGKDCAMLVTVTGPENPPALRRQDCTVRGSNGFSNYGNIAELTTAGTYTITVIDEVSGVTGVGTFEVVP
jgi:hypothetical protein